MYDLSSDPRSIDPRIIDPNSPENLQTLAFEFSRMPKIELHRHLEGAIRPSWLIPLAQRHGIQLPSFDPQELQQHLAVSTVPIHLDEVWKIFNTIGGLFTSPQVVREVTRQVVMDAAAENVVHLELRFSPIYMAEAHGLEPREVVQAVVDGAVEAEDRHGITCNLILIIERQRDITSHGWPVLDLAAHFSQNYGNKVVALDLANDEIRFPAKLFKDIFRKAEEYGLFRTVHAGEAGDGPVNVRCAVEELGAQRIGHGVLSVLDPQVVRMLVASRIPLEVCLVSNFFVGIVPDLIDHPARQLLAEGVRLSLNTDDPGLFGTNLVQEYLAAVTKLGLTPADLRLMGEQAVDQAFFKSEDEREAVRRRIQQPG